MFERYTEKARRVIFFARYEASMCGASQIEAEHILLGILREDKGLVAHFFPGGVATLQQSIKARITRGQHTPQACDFPLNGEAKRALAFAAEEAELFSHQHIGAEHLLLGLLRTENSLAAEILRERGLQLPAVREAVARYVEKQARWQEIQQETKQGAGLQTGELGATRELKPPEEQPRSRDDKWLGEVTQTCLALGLITQEELVNEFQRVAALRNFRPDAEALLRLLAQKGKADVQGLTTLALALRDEEKLQEFLAALPGA